MVYALIAGSVGLTLGVLLIRLRRGWVLVTVEGRSMVPALAPGDHVLVRRIPPTSIQVGQMVVVEKPVDGAWPTPPLAGGASPSTDRSWIVKRAVAGPGDPVPADVIAAVGGGPGADDGPAAGDVPQVPSGYFVLLGDNRDASFDSRIFGFVPAARILGPVRRVVPR
ncbi:S26 family signal peptidase [Micromonospora soli]|uniref:S26 family signal peptidase n=1 Tax=Micromonospora sp. NBRC 110009 TaxID=3061627 RepID=UPI002672DF09|nr:S26 family signal peptidase [Micromonospora sp. NBRC 110009]WKU01746.1 S26 family signal peptidase [Micromonospora sp. NBRC 110009]